MTSPRSMRPEEVNEKKLDLLTTAKILEHRAEKGNSVTISKELAIRLAQLCRDVAWQEEEAAV